MLATCDGCPSPAQDQPARCSTQIASVHPKSPPCLTPRSSPTARDAHIPNRGGHRPPQLIRLGPPIMQYRFAGALSQIVMFGQGFSASSGRSSVTWTPNLRIQGTASSRLAWQRQPRAAPQASVSLRWLRLSRAVALVMINRNGEYEVERLIENTQAKIEQPRREHGRENAAICWRSMLDEGGGRTRSCGRFGLRHAGRV